MFTEMSAVTANATVELNNRMEKLEDALQKPKPVSTLDIDLLHKQLVEMIELNDDEFSGKLKTALEQAITVQLKFEIRNETPLSAKEIAKREKQQKEEKARAEKEEKARLAEEAKAEKLRLAEEAKAEKIRLAEEAKAEKLRLAEEAKAEKEERESMKVEDKISADAFASKKKDTKNKEEKARLAEEAKAEKLRKQEEAKEEKARLAEEAKAEKLRKQEEAKEEKLRKQEEKLRKQEEAKANKKSNKKNTNTDTTQSQQPPSEFSLELFCEEVQVQQMDEVQSDTIGELVFESQSELDHILMESLTPAPTQPEKLTKEQQKEADKQRKEAERIAKEQQKEADRLAKIQQKEQERLAKEQQKEQEKLEKAQKKEQERLAKEAEKLAKASEPSNAGRKKKTDLKRDDDAHSDSEKESQEDSDEERENEEKEYTPIEGHNELFQLTGDKQKFVYRKYPDPETSQECVDKVGYLVKTKTAYKIAFFQQYKFLDQPQPQTQTL